MEDNSRETAYRAVIRKRNEQRSSIVHSKLFSDIFPLMCNAEEDTIILNPGLIEIYGDQNSGKSLLATEIISRVIVSLAVVAAESEIIYISLDNKFNLKNFITVLSKLSNASTNPILRDFKEENFLKRINLINCYTEEEFELTIINLDTILFNNTRVVSIVIDPLGEYCFMDCDENQFRTKQYFEEWLRKLNEICLKFKILLIYTRSEHLVNEENMNKSRSILNYSFYLKYSNKNSYRNLTVTTPNKKEVLKIVKINSEGMEFLAEE